MTDIRRVAITAARRTPESIQKAREAALRNPARLRPFAEKGQAR